MLDGDLLASQLPETRGWMSVSGVQTKHQIKLIDRKLVFVDHDGDYLLKPIPNGRFKHLDQAPANEHLTMQIARQIFRIETASNGLVFSVTLVRLISQSDLTNWVLTENC